jgi:hypothetical protein
MSIQRDECCIANPTRNSAVSTNVVRLRLRLRILNLNNNATAYLIQYLQTTHRFKSRRVLNYCTVGSTFRHFRLSLVGSRYDISYIAIH